MFVKIPKKHKLYVCGDIHEHKEQLYKCVEYIKPCLERRLVLLGDIFDKGFGVKCAEEIVDFIKPMVKQGIAYVVKGNHELKILNKAKKGKIPWTPQLEWLLEQPLAITFQFSNFTRLLAVHAGVTPKMTIDSVVNDVKACYVRTIDENNKPVSLIKTIEDGKMVMTPSKKGVLWHDVYDGRFGYIISGHNSQKDGVPKFYNYSCNIDTACYHTGKLTVQIFSESGLEDLLTFEGAPKYPNIDDMYTMMASDS